MRKVSEASTVEVRGPTRTKGLRIPTVLAVALLGGASVAGLASSASCHDSNARADANSCELFCIPMTQDAGTVCDTCADAGHCPTGCEPIG
jgi:hypothetical protein